VYSEPAAHPRRGTSSGFPPGFAKAGLLQSPTIQAIDMSNIVPFQFESHQIRTVTDEQGEPWFVAVDVCKALDLDNVSRALSRLDDDERAQVVDSDTLNSNKGSGINDLLNIINESGLYSLVLGSRKPEAKRFKKWVTSEVLPQIRRTGSYIAGRTSAEMFAESARLFLEQERRVLAVEAAQARQEAQVCALKQEIESNTRMLQQIETAGDHFTIIGWHRYAKMAGSLPLPQAAAMGKSATKFCKDHEIAMGETPDPRFGVVHTYPKWVLDDLFGESVQ